MHNRYSTRCWLTIVFLAATAFVNFGAAPSLQWTQPSFIQPQMMVQHRYFYDSVAGKYTVDRYLDDLQTRYGGVMPF